MKSPKLCALAGSLLLAGLLSCSFPLFAQSSPSTPGASWSTEYPRLLEGRYSAPTAVPAEGLEFELGEAQWTLQSGWLRLAEPTAGGAVTGLVFEGRGRFVIQVPDPMEQAQLARFTEGAASKELDVPFERLLIRAPRGLEDLVPGTSGGGVGGGSYEPSDLATERRERWLEDDRLDADARILAALESPVDDYLLATFATPDYGWLTLELEPWRREEITLTRREAGRRAESWLSLDQARDQGQADQDPFRIDHVEVQGDFTEAGDLPRTGLTRTHPRLGRLSVGLHMEALAEGLRVAPLSLHPLSRVTAVRVDGREVPFLQAAIGEGDSQLDDDLHDDDLLVALPRPTEAGQQLLVTVDYERQVLNYLSGRSWYPDTAHGYFANFHTGVFEITLPKRIEMRSMGYRQGEPVVEGSTRTETWVVDKPSIMLSFTFAERAESYVLERDDGEGPTVEVFGTDMGQEALLHNVAADVSNAAAYFGQLFDAPLETDRLVVSSIAGSHGQAFDGFLHMSEGSLRNEHPGATELFRAHETAHEWWGHRVRWASYRDQWLSEAFAEYSAMMFVEAATEKGDQWFDEILYSYRQALLGSAGGMLSKFSRVGVVPINDQHREAIGPIAMGSRAGTADAPGAYTAQAYVRGPWVLHMLRVMLRNLTGDDQVFVQVLSDFIERYDGRAASTEDFIASLSETAPGDWQWFFDQWVYDTTIPTYAWSWTTERGEGGQTVLAVTVHQENVPQGFRMPLPIRVDFGGGNQGQVVVLVDQPEETFRFPLPDKPREVELNPDHAVLAEMREL